MKLTEINSFEKRGWPWNKEVDTKIYNVFDELPIISIITPSYNHAKYIEETIRSVVLQNYPKLEYIVIDGGSKDGTVKILEKYNRWIDYWVSEKDSGQAEAINKGFRRARGEVIAWLNSDDYYAPQTFYHVLKRFKDDYDRIIYGDTIHFYEQYFDFRRKTRISSLLKKGFRYDLFPIVIQPSAFWGKKVFEVVGPLRTDLEYSFDWEWFIRAYRKHIPFFSCNKVLSYFRHNKTHKSGTGGKRRLEEICNVILEYHGRHTADFYKDLINRKKLHQLLKITYFLRINQLFDSLIYKLLYKDKVDYYTFKNIKNLWPLV